MKWYSEEELKKWMGHIITLPLLEQMEYKERRQCGNCPYWESQHDGYGFCWLKELSYQQYSRTYKDDECEVVSAR